MGIHGGTTHRLQDQCAVHELQRRAGQDVVFDARCGQLRHDGCVEADEHNSERAGDTACARRVGVTEHLQRVTGRKRRERYTVHVCEALKIYGRRGNGQRDGCHLPSADIDERRPRPADVQVALLARDG